MNTKTCTFCDNEKHINNFLKKYSECIDCKRARGLKRYYEKKDKISNHQKVYYEKNREKCYYRNKTKEVYNLEI